MISLRRLPGRTARSYGLASVLFRSGGVSACGWPIKTAFSLFSSNSSGSNGNRHNSTSNTSSKAVLRHPPQAQMVGATICTSFGRQPSPARRRRRRRANRTEKAFESTVNTMSGRVSRTRSISLSARRDRRGKAVSASPRPITESWLISSAEVRPAAVISGPPIPDQSTGPFICSTACISCAASTSPDASPARMNIRLVITFPQAGWPGCRQRYRPCLRLR